MNRIKFLIPVFFCVANAHSQVNDSSFHAVIRVIFSDSSVTKRLFFKDPQTERLVSYVYLNHKIKNALSNYSDIIAQQTGSEASALEFISVPERSVFLFSDAFFFSAQMHDLVHFVIFPTKFSVHDRESRLVLHTTTLTSHTDPTYQYLVLTYRLKKTDQNWAIIDKRIKKSHFRNIVVY